MFRNAFVQGVHSMVSVEVISNTQIVADSLGLVSIGFSGVHQSPVSGMPLTELHLILQVHSS